MSGSAWWGVRRSARRRTLTPALAVPLALALGGCASAPDTSAWLPRGGGEPAAFEGRTPAELEQLARVSTDLVAALVQLPETSPASVTLQHSPPRSAFGNTVLRALEDAGYGLQRVPVDQGTHYLAYSRRFAETEAGPITDYELSVGEIRLHRAYVHEGARVLPSSLLAIEGSAVRPDQIVLESTMFREQGGEGEAFISGVRAGGEVPANVDAVAIEAFDARAPERRTPTRELLDGARTRAALAIAEGGLELESRERVRRTVLIFEDATTRLMGPANKQAVRLLARDARAGDLFVITACTDADGHDEAARRRGARVIEEFAGHGVPVGAMRLGPCTRASYRHISDDSPVPIEIVQYREPAGERRR